MTPVQLKRGDNIVIRSQDYPATVAEVLDVCPISRLPEFPGGPDVRTTRKILREWNVDVVATIAVGRRGYIFAALHRTTIGDWRDLQGQLLEISLVQAGKGAGA